MSENRRFRVTVTVVLEYDTDPAHYGKINDPQEMLEIDREAFDNNPLIIIAHKNALWRANVEDITKDADACIEKNSANQIEDASYLAKTVILTGD